MPLQRSEDALEIIYRLKQDAEGKPLDEGAVREELARHLDGDPLAELREQGYVRLRDGIVELTPEGEKLGRTTLRLHRLAERLLVDVLSFDVGDAEPPACEFEHVISPEVEESICTVLGHPRECPHGLPIPEGECCRAERRVAEKVIGPLAELEPGQRARVVYILTKNHPRLHKLMAFGVVPGTEIRLHAKYPSFVVEVGETTIALDEDVAEDIFVAKLS